MAFTAAWLSVRSQQGELLLRVEDVDRSRARRAVEANQKRDLEWLGLTWDREVSPQRDRDYAPWLALLSERYFCQCTRRSIAEGGNLHPLSCRSAGHTEGAVRYALPDTPVRFVDRVHGMRQLHPLAFGDPVLRRRDGVYAYSLAVVADDIADGITEVVRGSDLLDYTAVQTVLWGAFGATPPTWLHAPMLVGENGEKLSKSKGDIGIATLREAGVDPQQILERVLGWLGQEPAPLEQVVFAPERIPVSELRLASPTAGLLD